MVRKRANQTPYSRFQFTNNRLTHRDALGDWKAIHEESHGVCLRLGLFARKMGHDKIANILKGLGYPEPGEIFAEIYTDFHGSDYVAGILSVQDPREALRPYVPLNKFEMEAKRPGLWDKLRKVRDYFRAECELCNPAAFVYVMNQI